MIFFNFIFLLSAMPLAERMMTFILFFNVSSLSPCGKRGPHDCLYDATAAVQ